MLLSDLAAFSFSHFWGLTTLFFLEGGWLLLSGAGVLQLSGKRVASFLEEGFATLRGEERKEGVTTFGEAKTCTIRGSNKRKHIE